MVQSELNRVGKYRKKIDGAIIGGRYEKLKKHSSRIQARVFAKQAEMQEEVKSIVNNEPSITHHFYIAFAEEIDRLRAKYSGESLMKELEILQFKWGTRGLKTEKLNKIKVYYVPSYKPVICIIARFDEGKFNINCFG